MSYIQGADRNQVVLLPETLDDYVGAENEVRVIDAFIDGLDIETMGFKAEAAREGRPGYDPRDMLKLYMYGYSNHIRSSRRLQKEAARNVEVMWLLKKIVPDFRCIADFRKDNAKAIKEVFRAFVKLCNGAGLLSHESVVIDGSKFRAVNADNKSYISANVSKVLKDIDAKIDQYMDEMDARDKEEAKPGELGKEDLSKVLDYLERRKEQLTDALKKIESEVTEYAKSVKMILKTRGLFFQTIILSACYQALMAAIPFFVLLAFGGNVGFFECFTTTLAVTSAVYFVPTPGNAGAAEGTFYVVFSALSQGYIFWAMLTWRFFSYYIYILVGPLIYLRMHWEKKHDTKKLH